MRLKNRPVLVKARLKNGELFYFTKQTPQKLKPRVLANGSMTATGTDPASVIQPISPPARLNFGTKVTKEEFDVPANEKPVRRRKLLARAWSGRS